MSNRQLSLCSDPGGRGGPPPLGPHVVKRQLELSASLFVECFLNLKPQLGAIRERQPSVHKCGWCEAILAAWEVTGPEAIAGQTGQEQPKELLQARSNSSAHAKGFHQFPTK